MAKAWRLSEEQTQKFEAASNVATELRMSAYDFYQKGELEEDEMFAEIAAANKQGEDSLRQVLGDARLLEYQLMQGHFVEAGLDHKAFEPPIFIHREDPLTGGTPPSAAGGS